MDRYHERSAIKKGKRRVCNECEVTVLSRYNPNKTCGPCEDTIAREKQGDVSDLLAIVS